MRRSLRRVVTSRRCAEHLTAIWPALRSPTSCRFAATVYTSDRGEVDFLMAWVSVPDLGMRPSEQRYEHVRRDGDEAVVRYVGRHRDFVDDLVFDRDGVVDLYPDLARRVATP